MQMLAMAGKESEMMYPGMNRQAAVTFWLRLRLEAPLIIQHHFEFSFSRSLPGLHAFLALEARHQIHELQAHLHQIRTAHILEP